MVVEEDGRRISMTPLALALALVLALALALEVLLAALFAATAPSCFSVPTPASAFGMLLARWGKPVPTTTPLILPVLAMLALAL